MGLNTFGWTPSEVTTDSAGNVVAGVTLTVFTDVTKATQVTTLYGKDGVTPIASGVVVSDNKGRFGFKASDTYSMLYVYDGSTADPWPIAAHEALDAGMASHAQAVADAQAAADSAAASATDAHNAANLVGAPADTAVKALVDNAASQTRGSLDVSYAARKVVNTPEGLRTPGVTTATTDPTVVIGVDTTTGLVFGIDRPTNSLAVSGDKGTTWTTGKAMPGGANHVQLHKVVNFKGKMYCFAIDGNDLRAGVYPSTGVPTTAAQAITWQGTRANLVTNPSFVSGQTGWTGRGSITFGTPTDGGFDGPNYARLTATAAGFIGVDTNTIPVTAGQQFAFSVYVRGTVGKEAQIFAVWTGAAQTGSGYSTLASATGWQRLTFTGTVPAGATAVAVRTGNNSATGLTGDVLDVDAALVELGTNTVNPFYVTGASDRVAVMKLSTSAAGSNKESLNGKSTGFAASATAMCVSDYGDFTGGPTIQRTTDGTTWTTVWNAPTSRHVHGLAPDPYHPGHWYATVGDGAANAVSVLRSTDDAATWQTVIDGGGGNLWQAVQVSYDAKFVYLGGDHYGGSAFYFDRDELVIRHLSPEWHYQKPVPGGVGGRIITDAATTSGSLTITGSFLPSDRGREVMTSNVPEFGANSNATEPNWLTAATTGSATLRKAATATGTGQTALIGGDRYLAGSYLGAVDPATGIYYFAAMDTSSAGTRKGLFYITHPGGPINVFYTWSDFGAFSYYIGPYEVFINDGKVYCGNRKFNALTVA